MRQTLPVPTINARVALAADVNTPALALRDLASDAAPKVREAVANNPTTPLDVLEKLVVDEKPMVRRAVAANLSPSARRIALASPDPATRAIAAQRNDLDADDLRKLINDPARDVRERLADVTTSAQVAIALANDPEPRVRANILQSTALPEDDVERLAQDPVAAVRSAAAGSRRLRAETLTRLAADRSAVVRWNVLVNNPERIDLARRIAGDSDEMNAIQARAQVANPREFTAFLGPIDLIG